MSSQKAPLARVFRRVEELQMNPSKEKVACLPTELYIVWAFKCTTEKMMFHFLHDSIQNPECFSISQGHVCRFYPLFLFWLECAVANWKLGIFRRWESQQPQLPEPALPRVFLQQSKVSSEVGSTRMCVEGAEMKVRGKSPSSLEVYRGGRLGY